jgi:hypothetical protein
MQFVLRSGVAGYRVSDSRFVDEIAGQIRLMHIVLKLGTNFLAAHSTVIQARVHRAAGLGIGFFDDGSLGGRGASLKSWRHRLAGLTRWTWDGPSPTP